MSLAKPVDYARFFGAIAQIEEPVISPSQDMAALRSSKKRDDRSITQAKMVFYKASSEDSAAAPLLDSY